MSARVRDVMTTRVVAVRGGATFKDIVALPIVVTPDEPVTSAARLMYHARVKRLPVVEEGGQLAGIVSRADVLSVYSRLDEEIRQEITKNVILNDSPPILTGSP